MTTSGGDSRVSIPSKNRKQIQEIKKSLAAGSNHTDDFIYATLIDCCMDPNESIRRLKMIHDLKEIAGNKHTVEDVYTMLKDCNMDPNEAAQRLLYIDTFHEVKKKHDRRKSISSDTSEEHKQTRGNQWRGANGGRGTFHSSKVFDDAGGGRNPSSGKDNGVTNRLERVSRPAFPALSGKDNTVHKTKSPANVNGTPALSNGSYLHKLAPELLAVRPTDVSSSASDPVVVSSQKTRYTCSVGTIKCEIIKRSGSSASNSRIPVAKNLSADIIPVIAESAVSDSKTQLKSEAVEENKSSQLSKEPLKVTVSDCTTLPTNTTHSVPVKESEVKLSAPKLDVHSVPEVESELNLSAAKLDEHLVHEVESELNLSAPKPDGLSFHEEESELNLSAPKVDVILEKVTISSHGSVIFPEHIQVPENYKTQFTFGSLDTCPDDCKSLSITESPQQNGEITSEPSLSNENVSPTAEKVENEDHQLPQHPENDLNTEVVEEPSSSIENGSSAQESELKDYTDHELPSQDGNISSDVAVKHEEIKLETLLPGGFQNPVLQTTHDYNYGFLPPMMAPHFVQLDALEPQNGSPLVASVMGPTTTTQPAVGPQSSIALSPPLFPYFRQYPSYIPYSPYYPHMYFPQNPPFMSHGVVPQQPPTTMVKFPAPSLNKDGSNEEAPVSQANDNSIHPTLQQGEDPQVWAQAGGREVPNFAPNYYFPLPHPHPMAFSPFYHSSQTMTTPSQPLVYHHQSHSNNGNIEQRSNQNTVLLNSQTT